MIHSIKIAFTLNLHELIADISCLCASLSIQNSPSSSFCQSAKQNECFVPGFPVANTMNIKYIRKVRESYLTSDSVKFSCTCRINSGHLSFLTNSSGVIATNLVLTLHSRVLRSLTRTLPRCWKGANTPRHVAIPDFYEGLRFS